MTTPRNLHVLDAARAVVDEIEQLLSQRRRFPNAAQLREASSSITANIREAYGRGDGPERRQFLRNARGSAEETDEHLRGHFKAERIEPTTYWRLHNRLITVSRMLTRLMARPVSSVDAPRKRQPKSRHVPPP
jgi:four helix bundle protein